MCSPPLSHCQHQGPLRSSLKDQAFGAAFFKNLYLKLIYRCCRIFPLGFRINIFEAQMQLPNMLSSFENYHFWRFEAFGIFPRCSQSRGTAGRKPGHARFPRTGLWHVLCGLISIVYTQRPPGLLSPPLRFTKLNIVFTLDIY